MLQIIGAVLIVLALALVTFWFWKAYQTQPKVPWVLTRPSKHDQQLAWAVDRVFHLLINYRLQIRRLSSGDFEAFCNSAMSKNVAAAIRNQFEFWTIDGSSEKELRENPEKVSKQHMQLYRHLQEFYGAHTPEAMSSLIIRATYMRYHNTHRRASKDAKFFEDFKKSKDYNPEHPWDVRYPHETYAV